MEAIEPADLVYFFGLCFAAVAACFFWLAVLFLSCFCLFCFWTDLGDLSPIILRGVFGVGRRGAKHLINPGSVNSNPQLSRNTKQAGWLIGCVDCGNEMNFPLKERRSDQEMAVASPDRAETPDAWTRGS